MEVKIEMDKTGFIVSAVVGSLGLLSAILGFAAEGTYWPARTGLGICAAIFLLAAQITLVVIGGYRKYRAIPSETKRIVCVVCAVVSWVLALIAFALLLSGATMGTSGLAAGGAVLTVVATALSVTSFVMLRRQPAASAASVRAATASPNNKAGVETQANGIPVAHPQPVDTAAAAGAPSKPGEQPAGAPDKLDELI